MKKKPAYAELGLKEALAVIRHELPNKPLFTPSTRRYIPMRHKALGVLLSGDKHPGLPTGCFIEVLGMEHSGKTTLLGAMIDAVVNQPADATHPVHRDGRIISVPVPRRAAIMDFEQIIDVPYLGRQVRNFRLAEFDGRGRLVNDDATVFIHQPDTLEEGVDILLRLIGTGEFGFVGIDSIAAMTTAEEVSKPMGANTIGLNARSLGKMFRISAPMIRRHGTVFACVNQWRDKIGVAFGDPRTSPGGKAARYWDAIKLDVSGPHKTPWFTDGKVVTIKAMKNKVSGVKRKVTYHLGAGLGISAEVELIEAALSCGVVVWKGRNSRVFVAPTMRKNKIVKARRVFSTMPEFIAALNTSEKLFQGVWTLCNRRGVTHWAGASLAGSGFDEEV